MAKPKTEPTAAMKAAEAAREAVKPLREAVQTAKEKLAEKDTDANKKALATAETKLKDASEKLSAAVKVENRERFENVGGGRVAKLLAGLKNLKGVANRRAYEFTADDVSTMFGALTKELQSARSSFDNALASTTEKKPGAAKEKFSFKKAE